MPGERIRTNKKKKTEKKKNNEQSAKKTIEKSWGKIKRNPQNETKRNETKRKEASDALVDKIKAKIFAHLYNMCVCTFPYATHTVRVCAAATLLLLLLLLLMLYTLWFFMSSDFRWAWPAKFCCHLDFAIHLPIKVFAHSFLHAVFSHR